jgi:L-threonylcarbamoyladenylate synthase
MSQTLILPVDAKDITGPHSRASLGRAAQILQDGGTVAFPTETVYGLGASALNAAAIEKIFLAKQRPSWDPLIVHVASEEMLSTVALHPIAQALIIHAGLPIAAPSANSFGRISPTTAQHVLEDLDGRIDAVLDGGPTTLGLESTVIDASAMPPTLYRHGMVSMEQLQVLVPGLISFVETPAMEGVPSPGVAMRHYAPRAKLVLVEGEGIELALQRAVHEARGKRIGILLPEDFAGIAETGITVWRWGRWSHPDEMALRLFAGLRALDGQGVDIIFCPLPPGVGADEGIKVSYLMLLSTSFPQPYKGT